MSHAADDNKGFILRDLDYKVEISTFFCVPLRISIAMGLGQVYELRNGQKKEFGMDGGS
jgi:hypothetical protein